MFALIVVLVSVAILGGPIFGDKLHAWSWLKTATWFDWSDYRGTLSARIFVPRLVAGNLNAYHTNDELNLITDLQIDPDSAEPFRELSATFYLDRFAVRIVSENDNAFFGIAESNTANRPQLSALEIGTVRTGFDLDLFRHPIFTFGINYDLHGDITGLITNRETTIRGVQGIYHLRYFSKESPMTIGAHAKALPGRIRDVPIVAKARLRVPIPYLDRGNEAKIFDWEVSVGLRPTVWHTSMLRYTTFSVAVEAGFRAVSMELNLENYANLTARWRGAYLQVSAAF